MTLSVKKKVDYNPIIYWFLLIKLISYFYHSPLKNRMKERSLLTFQRTLCVWNGEFVSLSVFLRWRLFFSFLARTKGKVADEYGSVPGKIADHTLHNNCFVNIPFCREIHLDHGLYVCMGSEMDVEITSILFITY